MAIRTAWAFFIDVPNIGAENLRWNALVHKLMELPEKEDTIIHKRAYFQGKKKITTGFKEAWGILKKHDFSPYVTRPVRNYYPDVDARIMREMLEIHTLLSGGVYVFPRVNIVLLSSDGDFADTLSLFDKKETRIYAFGKTRVSSKLRRVAYFSSTIANFAPHTLKKKPKARRSFPRPLFV